MKYLFTEIFNEFECIGGKCPETCCKGWNIYVDDETYGRYAACDEPLRSEVLGKIEPYEGKKRFALKSDGRCPFLDEQGLCEIYSKISPDALCNTCETYPRKLVNYYDVMLLTLSMSCPEVARLLINHTEALEFQFVEDDTAADVEGADWIRYNELINGMVITVDILGDKEIPIWKRLHLVLDVSQVVQQHLTNNTLGELREKIACYKDITWRNKKYDSMLPGNYRVTNASQFLNSLFSFIKLIGQKIEFTMNSLLLPDIPQDDVFHGWKEAFYEEAYDENEYEKISVQLVFEYYMDALKGKALDLNISKMLVYLTLLSTQEIYVFNRDGKLPESERSLLIARLSRVLEHSSMFDVLVKDLIQSNTRSGMYGLLGLLIA